VSDLGTMLTSYGVLIMHKWCMSYHGLSCQSVCSITSTSTSMQDISISIESSFPMDII
jgi:hypothetical protein